MKKILFMLPLLAVALVSCNKDNGDELSGDDIIQFKDQNFLNMLLFYPSLEDIVIDANGDEQISVKEAEAMTYLYLNILEDEPYYEISNIDEIKYFTSLTGLECLFQSVATADLSYNTLLTEAYFEGSKLTSINVSKCPQLKTLDVLDNNLSSLDVSRNTNLEDLYCSGNPLETLTISESQQDASWLNDVKTEYPDIEIIVK